MIRACIRIPIMIGINLWSRIMIGVRIRISIKSGARAGSLSLFYVVSGSVYFIGARIRIPIIHGAPIRCPCPDSKYYWSPYPDPYNFWSLI